MTGNIVGKILNNRYRITDRIGIGGMAEVYRAQDNVLGRTVAIKVMLPQYAADPTFTARFKQEAAAAANLQSPYIVNVYDWGCDNGTYFIVMEYVRGSDLKTAITQRGAINQRKAAEIGSQACQALTVAHGLDIVHRDIKPQNLMVQPDGNVKVMDFGIARAKNSVKTATASVLGTAHYISPEQAQGKELAATSDIYSLGIVLYEIATGVLPFDGPDAISVAMKQVNEEPLPPSAVNPDIDPSFEAIIMKALAKDPAARFQTATEMRRALNDFLAGRPVNLGNNAGFTSAQTALMGAVPVAAGVGAATAVMPAVANAGEAYPPNRYQNFNNQVAQEEEEAAKKKKKIIAIVAAILAVLLLGGIAFAFSGSGKSEVPDVTGMSLAKATKTIEAAGFEVGTTKSVADEDAKPGTVISQDPKAGAKKKEGTKINLTLCESDEKIEVPDVTGMSIEQAQDVLANEGFSVKVGKGKHSEDVPENYIISQDPAGGKEAAKGSVVTITPSLGSEGVEVPDVTNYSQDEATNTLQNAGFSVSVEQAASDTVPAGMVISQNPVGGSNLEKGKTVTITVSTGAEEVEVPYVVGMSVEQAQNNLYQFNVAINGPTDSSAIVTSQSITGTARPGDTITLATSSNVDPGQGGDDPNDGPDSDTGDSDAPEGVGGATSTEQQ